MEFLDSYPELVDVSGPILLEGGTIALIKQSPYCRKPSHDQSICIPPWKYRRCVQPCSPSCGPQSISIYQPRSISPCSPIYGRPQCVGPCGPIYQGPQCVSPCRPIYSRPQYVGSYCPQYVNPCRPYYPQCGYPRPYSPQCGYPKSYYPQCGYPKSYYPQCGVPRPSVCIPSGGQYQGPYWCRRCPQCGRIHPCDDLDFYYEI